VYDALLSLDNAHALGVAMRELAPRLRDLVLCYVDVHMDAEEGEGGLGVLFPYVASLVQLRTLVLDGCTKEEFLCRTLPRVPAQIEMHRFLAGCKRKCRHC
jgi:hypothetical protein